MDKKYRVCYNTDLPPFIVEFLTVKEIYTKLLNKYITSTLKGEIKIVFSNTKTIKNDKNTLPFREEFYISYRMTTSIFLKATIEEIISIEEFNTLFI